MKETQDKQNHMIATTLNELRQSIKLKKRKSELPEEQQRKMNEALCSIREGIKTKLPDRPKYETSVDKARIQEFEKTLVEEDPKIMECMESGLLTPELLHEKVLNCLGEQRRAPQRRVKYLEKRQKTGQAEPLTLSFPEENHDPLSNLVPTLHHE